MLRALVFSLVVSLFVALDSAHAAAQTAHAAAQTAHATADPSSDICARGLSSGEANARALALRARLESGSGAALWWWGWLGTFIGLTVVQGVVALAVEADDVRWPSFIGTISSVLAIGAALITPVRSHRLRARLRALDGMAGHQLLRATEREAERAASGEDEGRNVVSHSLGWAAALGGGLALWLAFDLPIQGALLLGASVAISELRIATSPTHAREVWAEYIAEDPQAATCVEQTQDESSARAPLPGPTFAVGPAGLGVGLVLTF